MGSLDQQMYLHKQMSDMHWLLVWDTELVRLLVPVRREQRVAQLVLLVLRLELKGPGTQVLQIAQDTQTKLGRMV